MSAERLFEFLGEIEDVLLPCWEEEYYSVDFSSYFLPLDRVSRVREQPNDEPSEKDSAKTANSDNAE